MAQNYETEAVVVIDGEEIGVYARFTVDSVAKRWSGLLDSDEPALRFWMVDGRRTVLRLPSGKEAPINPGEDTGGGASFIGSGPPPL